MIFQGIFFGEIWQLENQETFFFFLAFLMRKNRQLAKFSQEKNADTKEIEVRYLQQSFKKFWGTKSPKGGTT